MAKKIAVALPAVCALALLFPAIFADQTVFAGDVEFFEASRDRLVAEAWREGEGIPRWAPGILGGAPALASQELGLLYPPNLLLAILATDRAQAIGLALHLAIAALGARALARTLGQGSAPSLLAGIVYAFSGTFVSTHLTPVYVRSGAWLPWALAGLLRGGAGERRGLLVAVAALSGMYLAGDPQGCIVAALAACAISLAQGNTRKTPRVLGATLACAVAALLACAAQLVPAALAFKDTERAAGFSFEEATRWSLWPPELLGFLVPHLFGAEAAPGSSWFAAISPSHERPWGESHALGVVGLALAVASLVRVREDKQVRAGLALLVLFVPFAFGAYAPFYKLVHALPGGAPFRYPAKLLVPAVLGIALLAGAGLSHLLAPELAGRARKTALAVAGTLAVLGLVGTNVAAAFSDALGARIEGSPSFPLDGPRAIAFLAPRFAHVALVALGTLAVLFRGQGRKRLGWALVALAAVDLTVAARNGIALAPRELFTRTPRVAALLAEARAQDGEPARVAPTESAQRPTQDEAEVPPVARTYVAAREGLIPNTNLGQGVLSQGGFFSNAPARFDALDRREDLTPLRRVVLEGARYVLVTGRQAEAYGEGGALLARPCGERTLVKLGNAPRWAMIEGSVRFVDGPLASLAVVADPLFDPKRVTVLEAEGANSVRSSPLPGRARLSGRLGFHELAIDVEAPEGGWLVVRESYARGWTAQVDSGPPVPVVPADFIFRAVRLERGAKRVVFRYAAPGLWTGTVVSAATIVLLAAAAILGLLRPGKAGPIGVRAPGDGGKS